MHGPAVWVRKAAEGEEESAEPPCGGMVGCGPSPSNLSCLDGTLLVEMPPNPPCPAATRSAS